MGDVTLLELHPRGNVQLGPKSLRGSPSEPDEPVSEPVDASGGRSLGKLVLLVGFIAVVLVMATKLLGEDADEEIAGFDEET